MEQVQNKTVAFHTLGCKLNFTKPFWTKESAVGLLTCARRKSPHATKKSIFVAFSIGKRPQLTNEPPRKTWQKVFYLKYFFYESKEEMLPFVFPFWTKLFTINCCKAIITIMSKNPGLKTICTQRGTARALLTV